MPRRECRLRRLVLPVVFGLIACVCAETSTAHDEPAPPDTSQATFTELAALSGFLLPYEQAWSPDGHHLALIRPAGLFILDCDSPHEQPRLVLPGNVRKLVWSPDGTMVGAKLRSPATNQGDSIRVVAIEDGTVVATLPAEGAVTLLWTRSNTIHVWGSGPSRHLTHEGPRSASLGHGIAAPMSAVAPQHVLLSALDSNADRYLVRLDEATDTEVPLISATARLGGANIFVGGGFASGTRFLVNYEHRGEHNAILDADGALVCEFPRTGVLTDFVATSISSDGATVVGFLETDSDWEVLTSTVIATDACGGHVTTVQGIPCGTFPFLAPHSQYLAYTDPKTRSVHVGTFTVAAR